MRFVSCCVDICSLATQMSEGWALTRVLCERCAAGKIEGDVRVSGYPKVQETFARIMGYVEQSDIHSPNVRPCPRPPVHTPPWSTQAFAPINVAFVFHYGAGTLLLLCPSSPLKVLCSFLMMHLCITDHRVGVPGVQRAATIWQGGRAQRCVRLCARGTFSSTTPVKRSSTWSAS